MRTTEQLHAFWHERGEAPFIEGVHIAGQITVGDLGADQWRIGTAVPVVYSLDPVENFPMYIGSTCDLWRRLLEHQRRSPWWPEVYTIRWQACPTLDVARTMEQFWIEALHPMMNIHHSPFPAEARSHRKMFEVAS